MPLSGGRARAFPYAERVGPKPLERGSAEQMALDVEGIVCGGLDVQEALRGVVAVEVQDVGSGATTRP